MKVLIVDDDREISDLLKLKLRGEGFLVDSASDGEKGEFLVLTNDYDLVILDLNLPHKNGDEICKKLRQEQKTMPIMILTVDLTGENKIKLLNSGADDYLTKPFSFEELLARIKALLRRPKQITSPILQIEDLILDKDRQKVSRAGKEIYLTMKEFTLLEFLMSHTGFVVSRAAILEHVWDSEGDAFSNAIETHISNLRKKINKSNNKDLIETLSGRGYRIG